MFPGDVATFLQTQKEDAEPTMADFARSFWPTYAPPPKREQITRQTLPVAHGRNNTQFSSTKKTLKLPTASLVVEPVPNMVSYRLTKRSSDEDYQAPLSDQKGVRSGLAKDGLRHGLAVLDQASPAVKVPAPRSATLSVPKLSMSLLPCDNFCVLEKVSSRRVYYHIL